MPTTGRDLSTQPNLTGSEKEIGGRGEDGEGRREGGYHDF